MSVKCEVPKKAVTTEFDLERKAFVGRKFQILDSLHINSSVLGF